MDPKLNNTHTATVKMTKEKGINKFVTSCVFVLVYELPYGTLVSVGLIDKKNQIFILPIYTCRHISSNMEAVFFI